MDRHCAELWHVEIMFARLRLLLVESDPNIGDIMSDVMALVNARHRIASPIAIRIGIETLTTGPWTDVDRAMALAKEIDHYQNLDYSKSTTISDMIKSVIAFRKNVHLGLPISWPQKDRTLWNKTA